MGNYRHVFDEAQSIAKTLSYVELKKAVEDWRNHPELFHFIMASDTMREQDSGALKIASEINPIFTKALISKGSYRFPTLDAVESRHILLLSFLQRTIGNEWGSVVEIGGGYGNFLRLVHDKIIYTRWFIVDIRHISFLQNYVLNEEGVQEFELDREVPDRKIDLVIATHSLSEFDEETFDNYLEKISKSTYLFYAAHRYSPEPLEVKGVKIDKYFDPIARLSYEANNSVMVLLKNRFTMG